MCLPPTGLQAARLLCQQLTEKTQAIKQAFHRTHLRSLNPPIAFEQVRRVSLRINRATSVTRVKYSDLRAFRDHLKTVIRYGDTEQADEAENALAQLNGLDPRQCGLSVIPAMPSCWTCLTVGIVCNEPTSTA